ncbi:glutathione-disulfide reductase [Kaistia dalseonensis]|uniref:Glutathione reductase n=1 Tax=Kaistia dalseonensis TaxID=410840 RepID=A0ABU0H3E5_9HYPH|nr:glutathione-disulfide reductase [Kaistia dalseonensis]MCX5494236.1 glutathione-disulfide reductase [Kaistia dalseonensis]MDQ0436816.1 glutathione reductase (NADPH) [Kaistia dalseonensis]
MTEFDVDLFVIGAGSGGVRAGRIAASHGARVMVAEEYRVGGTCVIRGCVPKKLFVYASRFTEEFEDAVGFGWTVGETQFDWPTLLAHKDREIDRLNGIYIRNLERSGATLVAMRATIEDPHTVRLADGRVVTAKYILVATGAAPYIDPDLPGRELAISSNEAFHLPRLPKQIVVVGGGFIAVEFAGIFNGLGVETTLIHRGDALLRGFDADLRHMLKDEIEKKGVRVILGDELVGIEKSADGLVARTKGGLALPAGEVMIATGRQPNTRGIGLENAGVATDGAGAVIVDEYSQSNVPSIYAVGDVTNRVNLTPVAIREGHAFADTVFGGKRVSVDHLGIPKAVFSQPEIGSVGLTEAEALAEFAAVDIYRATFRPMKHTLTGRDEKMLMKLIVDAETDRVLGCHILGVDAAEITQIVAIPLKMRATKADFDSAMALHPTVAEELVTMREPTIRHRR